MQGNNVPERTRNFVFELTRRKQSRLHHLPLIRHLHVRLPSLFFLGTQAQQYSAASVGSAPSAAGSEDKPTGKVVLPKLLKHTGDEQLAGDIDVGSPAGAWGPDDEEKDDWANLFGMDGARTREGGASPAANLPRFNDFMMDDMSFSFSYDY
ncbi:unnamed protein product [Ectocarpus sp. 13 AM-2016]